MSIPKRVAEVFKKKNAKAETPDTLATLVITCDMKTGAFRLTGNVLQMPDYTAKLLVTALNQIINEKPDPIAPVTKEPQAPEIIH